MKRQFLAAAAILLTLSAAVAAPGGDPRCAPRGGAGLFPPEARLMMFADMQEQAASGAVDVDTLRQMQRDKLRAMNGDQRKAYVDKLVARFKALPAAEQKKLKTEADAWRASHPRPEGGWRGDRSDCPPPDGK